VGLFSAKLHSEQILKGKFLEVSHKAASASLMQLRSRSKLKSQLVSPKALVSDKELLQNLCPSAHNLLQEVPKVLSDLGVRLEHLQVFQVGWVSQALDLFPSLNQV
jgi:hypothetical protein